MIVKNKISTPATLICFLIIFLSGCSESKKEFQNQNNPKPNNGNILSNTAITNTQGIKKEIDLLNYIGKSKSDIKNDLGNPNRVDNTQSAELYYYDTFYLAIGDDKVISIVISNAGKTVNGVSIGMIPKDIKLKIGNPTKESNNDGFIMEYRLNNNSISLQFYCNDFRSPVNTITVADLTYGKESPMEVTKEKIESLIEGNWILEKNIHEKNLSIYIQTFSNGIKDENLGSWNTKYSITSNNTIVFHNQQRNEDVEYYIEFYEDGDRLEIYTLDQYGDRQFEYIYYRYN